MLKGSQSESGYVLAAGTETENVLTSFCRSQHSHNDHFTNLGCKLLMAEQMHMMLSASGTIPMFMVVDKILQSFHQAFYMDSHTRNSATTFYLS